MAVYVVLLLCTVGPRCRAEMIENIEWKRTTVPGIVSEPCPGRPGSNATRVCHITPRASTDSSGVTQWTGHNWSFFPAFGNKGGGQWDPPLIDACLHPETKDHVRESEELSRDKNAPYDKVFIMLRKLVRVSKGSPSQSPNDISAYIKITEFILEFQVAIVPPFSVMPSMVVWCWCLQEDRIRNRNWLVDRRQNEQGTKLYPNATDVTLFMTHIMEIFVSGHSCYLQCS